MAEQDIADIIATTDGDTSWGDDLRGAIDTISKRQTTFYGSNGSTQLTVFGHATGASTNVATSYTGYHEYWAFANIRDRYITALGFHVNGGMATPGNTARFGIYTMSEAGEPGTLVIDLGTVDCSVTGTKTLSGLTLSMPAGLYAAVTVQSETWTCKMLNVTLPCGKLNTNGGAWHYRAGSTGVLASTALPANAYAISAWPNSGIAQSLFHIVAES